MKRALSILMIFAVLLCGCTTKVAPTEQTNSLLDEYINNMEEYEKSVREYGEVASYVHMENGFVVTMLYPQTGLKKLDKAITAWIDETVEKYKGEVNTTDEAEDSAELTATYESYYVGEKVVSIKMKGTFLSPNMAHPEDFVKTFCVDTKSGKLLDINFLLKNDAREKFEALVIEKAGIEIDAVDENMLNNFVFINDGIVIVLERGMYLPSSDGVREVLLTYYEIADLIKDAFVFKLPDKEIETEPATENDPEIPTEPATETPTEICERTIDPNKPMLALTFDDGPSAHTDRLLDIFKQNGGKGTFFVLGNLIDGRKNTLLRISDEGHEIGNHSWDHRKMTNLTEQEITDEIMMTRAKIYEVTGKDCVIMRPPSGAWNDDVKAVGKEVGVAFVNWSVDTLDWKSRDAEAVYNEIINNASDGAIILCHDLHETTVDAMETVIPKLIEDGYQLVTVSELMSFSKKPLEPGKIHYKK